MASTPHYVIEIIRAENVPKLDVASESDPYVRFWVENSAKEMKGYKFESIRKDDNPNPIWNCVRNLGITPELGDSLIVSLFDEDASADELIGKLRIPLSEITSQPKLFKVPHKKWGIEIRLVPVPKVMKKTLFLIRHGESKWNEAQSQKNVQGMLNYDHPLSEIGISQCLSFRQRWHSARTEKVTPRITEWLQADCIFASPLTRAAQTAFITTDGHPHLQGKKRSIVLWSSVREVKNAGGLDTVGNFLGADIERRVRQHCSESEAASIGADSSFQVGDTESAWWTKANNYESKHQIKARLIDFISRVCYYPNEHATIVVGHSLFFQQLCKKFMSPDFKKNFPEKAKSISTTIMANATCLAIEVDFSGAKPIITSYNNLFD